MKLSNNLYLYPERGILDCNTYVIRDDLSIIIDAGSPQFLPMLIRDMREDGIRPEDIAVIANTHLHGDHCWANEVFRKSSKAKITIHPVQKKYYDVAVTETAKFFGFQPVDFKEDSYFDDNKLNTGSQDIELIHSPGHSPDSICFYCRKDKTLICGDVIFNQNTGRIDLPGGSGAKLRQSIEELSQIEIERLLPGHMDTIIGIEKIRGNFEYIKKHILGWL